MTTLREALAEYGYDAYLITASGEGPHTCLVTVSATPAGLSCPISKTAARNIRRQPKVSFLWSRLAPGAYSIVMNAEAVLERRDGVDLAHFRLTKAVFHRAGPKPEGSTGPCPSDCRPIALPEGDGG